MPAINLKNSRGKTTLQVFFILFYLASLTFGYLWYMYSSSTACVANNNSEKGNIAGSNNIQDLCRIAGFTDQPSCVARGDLAKSRF